MADECYGATFGVTVGVCSAEVRREGNFQRRWRSECFGVQCKTKATQKRVSCPGVA